MANPERGIERFSSVLDWGRPCTVRTCQHIADYWCWYEVRTARANPLTWVRKRAECERHAKQFAKKFKLTMPKG